MSTSATAVHLSKSRYIAGLQCPKALWWRVHEPDAPELVPGEGLDAIFTRGRKVGELARAHVPGGVLIDLPYGDFDARVAASARAIAGGAPAVYEASFFEDGVFVAVDILERGRDGFVLAEVKSTLRVKEAHLPDVAIQVHVLRAAGIPIERAEVMHLNRDCRYPDLGSLFVRAGVTALIGPALEEVPAALAVLKAAVSGPLPTIAPGPHCTAPYECPFIARCWPAPPEHHVSTLYKIRPKKLALLEAEGIETLLELPEDFKGSPIALRQVRSVKAKDVVVEPGLGRDLARLKLPIACLDFETISPAVPVWPGCGPYGQIPVQFSGHVIGADGFTHHEWLAQGPGDPREEVAERVLAACAGAKSILAWGATFEKGCLKSLADALPHLRPGLLALSARIKDMLPIVRNNVYHPDFGGSFSLKSVLPALVPGLGYGDLEIQDGSVASAALEALLLDAESLEPEVRLALRKNLLAYCERDTLAMVRLYERLGELVKGHAGERVL